MPHLKKLSDYVDINEFVQLLTSEDTKDFAYHAMKGEMSGVNPDDVFESIDRDRVSDILKTYEDQSLKTTVFKDMAFEDSIYLTPEMAEELTDVLDQFYFTMTISSADFEQTLDNPGSTYGGESWTYGRKKDLQVSSYTSHKYTVRDGEIRFYDRRREKDFRGRKWVKIETGNTGEGIGEVASAALQKYIEALSDVTGDKSVHIQDLIRLKSTKLNQLLDDIQETEKGFVVNLNSAFSTVPMDYPDVSMTREQQLKKAKLDAFYTLATMGKMKKAIDIGTSPVLNSDTGTFYQGDLTEMNVTFASKEDAVDFIYSILGKKNINRSFLNNEQLADQAHKSHLQGQGPSYAREYFVHVPKGKEVGEAVYLDKHSYWTLYDDVNIPNYDYSKGTYEVSLPGNKVEERTLEMGWHGYENDEYSLAFDRYLLGVREGSHKVEPVYTFQEGDPMRAPTYTMIDNWDGGVSIDHYPDGWSKPSDDQMAEFRSRYTSWTSADFQEEFNGAAEFPTIHFNVNDPFNYELHSSTYEGQVPVLRIYRPDINRIPKQQALELGYVILPMPQSHKELEDFLMTANVESKAFKDVATLMSDDEEHVERNAEGYITKRTYMVKPDPIAFGNAVANYDRILDPWYEIIQNDLGYDVKSWELSDISKDKQKVKEVFNFLGETEKIKMGDQDFTVKEVILMRFLAAAMRDGSQEEVEYVMELIDWAGIGLKWGTIVGFVATVIGVGLQIPFLWIIYHGQNKSLTMQDKFYELSVEQMEAFREQNRLAKGQSTLKEKVRIYNQSAPDKLAEYKDVWDKTGSFPEFLVGRRSELVEFFEWQNKMYQKQHSGRNTGGSGEALGGSGKGRFLEAMLYTKASGYYPLTALQYDFAVQQGLIDKLIREEITQRDMYEALERMTFEYEGQTYNGVDKLEDKYKYEHEEIRDLKPSSMVAGTMYSGTREAKTEVVIEMGTSNAAWEKQENGEYKENKDIVVYRTHYTDEAADESAKGKNAHGDEGAMKDLKGPVGNGHLIHYITYATNDRDKIMNKPDGSVDGQQVRRYKSVFKSGRLGQTDDSTTRAAVDYNIREHFIHNNLRMPSNAALRYLSEHITLTSINYDPSIGNPARSIIIAEEMMKHLKNPVMKGLIEESVRLSSEGNDVESARKLIEAYEYFGAKLRPYAKVEDLQISIRENVSRLIKSQLLDLKKIKEFIIENYPELVEKFGGREGLSKAVDAFMSEGQASSITKPAGMRDTTFVNLLTALDTYSRNQLGRVEQKGGFGSDKIEYKPLSGHEQINMIKNIVAMITYGIEGVTEDGKDLRIDTYTMTEKTGFIPEEGTKANEAYNKLNWILRGSGLFENPKLIFRELTVYGHSNLAMYELTAASLEDFVQNKLLREWKGDDHEARVERLNGSLDHIVALVQSGSGDFSAIRGEVYKELLTVFKEHNDHIIQNTDMVTEMTDEEKARERDIFNDNETKFESKIEGLKTDIRSEFEKLFACFEDAELPKHELRRALEDILNIEFEKVGIWHQKNFEQILEIVRSLNSGIEETQQKIKQKERLGRFTIGSGYTEKLKRNSYAKNINENQRVITSSTDLAEFIRDALTDTLQTAINKQEQIEESRKIAEEKYQRELEAQRKELAKKGLNPEMVEGAETGSPRKMAEGFGIPEAVLEEAEKRGNLSEVIFNYTRNADFVENHPELMKLKLELSAYTNYAKKKPEYTELVKDFQEALIRERYREMVDARLEEREVVHRSAEEILFRIIDQKKYEEKEREALKDYVSRVDKAVDKRIEEERRKEEERKRKGK